MRARRFQIVAICAFVLALLAVPGTFAKNKDTTPGRLLTGKVLDKQDNAVINAVVYVTDTRTRAVKTYIVGPDGTYRFPALATVFLRWLPMWIMRFMHNRTGRAATPNA
jgi:hypothetical protein